MKWHFFYVSDYVKCPVAENLWEETKGYDDTVELADPCCGDRQGGSGHRPGEEGRVKAGLEQPGRGNCLEVCLVYTKSGVGDNC